MPGQLSNQEILVNNWLRSQPIFLKKIVSTNLNGAKISQNFSNLLLSLRSNISFEKTAKFYLQSQKAKKSSKANRKNKVLLRMEIFGGTYMRLRYSPCVTSKGNPEKLKMKRFQQ